MIITSGLTYHIITENKNTKTKTTAQLTCIKTSEVDPDFFKNPPVAVHNMKKEVMVNNCRRTHINLSTFWWPQQSSKLA